MASSYSCPVCGYDPGRDAGKYPSLARIRAEKVPFGGGHAPGPEEIARLESEISALDEEMSLPEVATSPSKLLELSRSQQEKRERLDSLYELWEQLESE